MRHVTLRRVFPLSAIINLEYLVSMIQSPTQNRFGMIVGDLA